MNILVSTICFVNRQKPGAEIYATFAQRLIEDVMNKTPYDIMITTNEPDHFLNQKSIYGDRVIIRIEPLENHRLVVGVFNQLLKFYSIKDIDSKYDWVLYLDCDAGISDTWDINEVKNMLNTNISSGIDMLGTRTNCILHTELQDHEIKVKEHKKLIDAGQVNPYFAGNLFSNKFFFYEVSTENGPKEWFDAVLPSEHVFIVKNDERLPKMSKTFEDFCYKFETQGDHPITVDMEAFEIGVSALLSGYKMGDFGNYGLYHIIKVTCNLNNWEKVKY
jgi:hypothetical protein